MRNLLWCGLVVASCSTGTSATQGGDAAFHRPDSSSSSTSSHGHDASGGHTSHDAQTTGCTSPSACDSGLCVSGACAPASCTDGRKDGQETDVDCGGSQCIACDIGEACLLPRDCREGVCSASPSGVDGGAEDAAPTPHPGYCQAASPDDGVKNDSETDVDCGGALLADGLPNPASDGAIACAQGLTCRLGTDCQQGVCNANVGAGGGPIDCPAGMSCTCQPPFDDDGVKNDSETDIDCGGGTATSTDGAPACGTNQHCLVDADCQSLVCAPAGLCAPPSAFDGVMNDSETDIDCGGALSMGGSQNPASDGARPCADDKGCVLDVDCLSGFCSVLSHVCVDGQSCKGLVLPAVIQDLISCYPPATCPDGSTCNTTSYDCVDPTTGDVVGVPDPNGAGQSAGIDTCGVGESTDPIASQKHESCCRSLLLPDSSMRLDKYEVTAGRMRQFVEALDYDVVDWAKEQIAAGTAAGQSLSASIPASAIAILPHSADTGDVMNAVLQLGATTIDVTSPEQGCYVKSGAGGASVYYWDAGTLATLSAPPRSFTQDYYDIKSMNCALYQMYAAFCAWDGGHLATPTELAEAYGPSTYPWGATPLPNPYPYQAMGGQRNPWCGGTVSTALPNVSMINQLSMSTGTPAVGLTVNWLNSNNTGNAGCFYYYPSYPGSDPNAAVPDTLSQGLDFSPQIAAPGRFFLDVTAAKSPSFGTKEGWQDLGANMFDLEQVTTLTGGGTLCDCTGVTGPNDGSLPGCTCPYGSIPNGIQRAGNLPAATLEGGSWEGHSAFNPAASAYWSLNDGGVALNFQYGKVGARCARPAETPP